MANEECARLASYGIEDSAVKGVGRGLPEDRIL